MSQDSQAPGEDDGGGKRRRRPDPTPVQRALGLLVRREHSRKELRRKLEARGVADDEAEVAIERMVEGGWQDDRRFAISLARMRVSTGYGPLRIRAELGTHGLADEVIEAAFADLAESGDDDWLAGARRLVGRRLGPARENDLVQRRKAAELLFRRGFGGDTVRAATAFDPDDD
ncbi:regulatory protein RecX [Luteimonas sp. MC1782]|uniref:RecX family transcriptional regulator n=1 Tax=Luteimonas sp. MC1782 TaxID=2760305 RepID=UPI0016000EDA|nr:regulatory protein RecX [Luteimonas sp. MC1782]